MGIDISRLGPAAQRQLLQKLQSGQEAARSKYSNEKATRRMPNGTIYTFDSQREARRYDELVLLLAAGRIRNLRLQQTFTLQEAYTTSDGERVRAITYKADFVYEQISRCNVFHEDGLTNQEKCWCKIVEDAKGFRTDKYRMKRKMMQDRLGITIQEV